MAFLEPGVTADERTWDASVETRLPVPPETEPTAWLVIGTPEQIETTEDK